MNLDLQKASMWKRISAWLFDGILLSVVAVGAAFLLSLLLGYDGHSTALEDAYDRYEAQYGITFDISQEEYLAMPADQQKNYDDAYQALLADETAMYEYNMVVNLTLVITSLGILAAFLILEFAVPLLLGNGQTLGKKIFSLAVVRRDLVGLPPVQLFIRTVLGKFTVETMVPVYVVIMLLFNTVGLFGTLLLLGLLAAQLLLVGLNRNRAAIHDILAGTVVVDFASQMIFRTTEDLIRYKNKLHAEEAARKDY